MTPAEASEYLSLQMHWDTAYTFSEADGVWKAVRIGAPLEVHTADSPWELRQLVRRHYVPFRNGDQPDWQGCSL